MVVVDGGGILVGIAIEDANAVVGAASHQFATNEHRMKQIEGKLQKIIAHVRGHAIVEPAIGGVANVGVAIRVAVARRRVLRLSHMREETGRWSVNPMLSRIERRRMNIESIASIRERFVQEKSCMECGPPSLADSMRSKHG